MAGLGIGTGRSPKPGMGATGPRGSREISHALGYGNLAASSRGLLKEKSRGSFRVSLGRGSGAPQEDLLAALARIAQALPDLRAADACVVSIQRLMRLASPMRVPPLNQQHDDDGLFCNAPA